MSFDCFSLNFTHLWHIFYWLRYTQSIIIPYPTLHCGCGRTVVSLSVSVGFPNLERMDSWEMMVTIIYIYLYTCSHESNTTSVQMQLYDCFSKNAIVEHTMVNVDWVSRLAIVPSYIVNNTASFHYYYYYYYLHYK